MEPKNETWHEERDTETNEPAKRLSAARDAYMAACETVADAEREREKARAEYESAETAYLKSLRGE